MKINIHIYIYSGRTKQHLPGVRNEEHLPGVRTKEHLPAVRLLHRQDPHANGQQLTEPRQVAGATRTLSGTLSGFLS